MRTLSAKLILLLVLAALVPLLLCGTASILTSWRASHRLVVQGNLNVARQVAERIDLYVTGDQRILRALAESLSHVGLQDWQMEAILRSYALNFDELRSIHLTDLSGRALLSSRPQAGPVNLADETAFQQAYRGSCYRSGVHLAGDLTPTITLATPVRRRDRIEGVLVAQANLLDLWRMVDEIRIGQKGYALVVSQSGQLIAHGRHQAKVGILRRQSLRGLALVGELLRGKAATASYRNPQGVEVLGAAAPIRTLGGGVIIEQPLEEAYAIPRQTTLRLLILGSLFLALMVATGVWCGRRQIVRPIQVLIQGTRRVGSGELSQPVELASQDELAQLSQAFNRMMEQLARLQADIRKSERLATFGRIAAGLVHDFKHPLKNLENSSRILLRLPDNPDCRRHFRRMVEREFATLNRFLDDLSQLTRPIPLRRVRLDLNPFVRKVLSLYQEEAASRGIALQAALLPEPLWVEGDRFALERALRNLVANALEAMPQGGSLRVELTKTASGAEIEVRDTGHGIPPEQLAVLFEEFTTTKREGLGLGLAVTRKIVEGHGGTIEVESQLDQGSCFRLRLPASEAPEPLPA